MKPSLLVLAAGMGSRYGGLKQMDRLGPNGESIIDYSVYDAARAGFGKVIFVLREEIVDDFYSLFANKYKSKLEVDHVVVCAGQESNRTLFEQLQGQQDSAVYLIGGADVARELDAKIAIDQATRLAVRL